MIKREDIDDNILISLNKRNENWQIVEDIKNDLSSHMEDYANYQSSNNLKIATVERELNNYKSTMAGLNPNQEAKQTVTGHGTISLPKSAANGQVGVSVKGLSLKNELNYNRDTWAEWDKSTRAIVDNTGVEITGNGSITIDIKPKPLTKYGFLLNVVSNNINGFLWTGAASYPFNDAWVVLSKTLGNVKSVKVTKDSWSINKFRLFTINESEDNKIKIRDLRIFELPIGSEIESDFNTMTADQLAQKYPYIKGDSTKSTVSASRIKSVGKNLFDSRLEVGFWTDSGGKDGTTTYKRFKDLIKVRPNTTYTISGLNLTAPNRFLSEFDSSKKHIIRTELSSWTFTTGSTTSYITFSYANKLSEILDKPQLERGNTATEYEPYKEDISYVTAKDKDNKIVNLRSLPNGVRDEIDLDEGELIKSVGEHVLSHEDIASIVTVSDNVERLNTKSTFLQDANKKKWGPSQPTNSLQIDGWLEKSFADSLDNIGTFYTQGSGAITFLFPKGTTLEQAKEQLAGTKLIYQLAEPIITPIQASGALLSNPSGTVYVENVVADAGLYGDKLNILHTDLPISCIEKLSKVDFNTGVETELDSSKCVIAEDKLSFTHPDLTRNDIVFFTYYHNVEGTQGETTIEYYDSRYVLKDDVTGKFYKVVPKVSNGELINDLVEV